MIDTYVTGPEEGHIVINCKFYINDFISLTPCNVGDFVRDKWGYYKVMKIVDRAGDYTLFQGYEMKVDEYRNEKINEILK